MEQTNAILAGLKDIFKDLASKQLSLPNRLFSVIGSLLSVP